VSLQQGEVYVVWRAGVHADADDLCKRHQRETGGIVPAAVSASGQTSDALQLELDVPGQCATGFGRCNLLLAREGVGSDARSIGNRWH
jgi:hypothetical protein